VGMYSKDGEYVDFDEPCKCVGQVHTCTCTLYITCMYAILRNQGISL
jgi:hypothetical protein